MGAIGGMLGMSGGVGGSGINGPGSAGIMPVTDQYIIQNAQSQTQNGIVQQQALLDALKGQNGLGNQSTVYGQMMNVASGLGPNPAQAQYQQNIQDLAKQQSGAISSIKGISPALQARMVAQQGSSAMQNAAAAGATSLANQQLGALSAAGGIANQQASNQVGATNAYTGANLQNMANLYGAAGQMNNAAVGNQSSMNSANAALAGGIMGGQQKAIGGLAQAGAMAAGVPMPMYSGGEVRGPTSAAGQHLRNFKAGGFVPGKAQVAGDSPKNDTVDAKLSPGEVVLPRSVMNTKNPSAAAAKFVEALMAKKGKK